MSLLLFKDEADLRLDSFSCEQNLHTFITWCEWLHFFDDLPFDVELQVFVFEFPNVFAQCCGSSLVF